ncbi:hypothetical protein [Sinomonas sp. G460-2]|uniref:hypothetical protein n=1 Tax=Sinomonas sp. G460-2 TaxID=3393464 RepID=UPI0039F0539E
MSLAWADDKTINVRVETRNEMDRTLDEGVAALRQLSIATQGPGILVTRRSPSEFTIELHDSIPHGTTCEKQVWVGVPWKADSTPTSSATR